jgi:hypothetical protein
MHSRERVVLGLFAGISVLMILLLGSPLGGDGALSARNFCPLLGALIGGVLVLVCTNRPNNWKGNGETWLKNERLAWNLIGLGLIAWCIGETIWRYYRAVGLNPFPSLADLGYSWYPPLVFIGLLLLPSSQSAQKQRFLAMDSLISVGALLSIAWFLLLGSLAQTPNESILAKTLGLYYPTTDALLLSCTVFLVLRGSNQSAARRLSLFIAGIGLLILTASDFSFNVQSSLQTYMEGTWADLGWPLGFMTIGLAAYVRCFWPITTVQQQPQTSSKHQGFGFAQAVPYFLLAVLFLLLVFNILSKDATQESIRLVLVIATMIVLGLVLVRQVLTMQENTQLVQAQQVLIQEMEGINQSIAERNAAFETGITHLKDIQTRLANGDVHARAYIATGELWTLANGLNLMADRMMRSDRNQKDAQNITKAISEFSQALVQMKSGNPLILPVSCLHIPEMHHLFQVMGLKPEKETTTHSAPPQAGVPPLYPYQNTFTPFSSPRQSPTSSGDLWKSPSERSQRRSGTP